ncbi:DUF2057 family protein [Vibrio cholerae]|nr:DUF2057 family protein [Vibrio cholerae]HDZ9470580.1 DUF2057 family protein [Vibrio cholerae]
MKLNPLILGLLLSFSAGHSLADVVLKVPENIDLLSVNMQKPKSEGGLFGDKTIMLKDGTNQIVFRYIPTFDDGDDVKKVYSDTIIAKFESENATLHFKIPSYRNIKEANEKIQTMEWQLVDEKEQSVALVEDKLLNPGVQWGRNYSQEATEYNQNGGVAAIGYLKVVTNEAQLSENTTQVIMSEASQPLEVVGSSNNLTQLQLWYSKASKEERKAFKKWMVDQE